jgi:alginate biosynthesis protein AlgX
MRNRFINAASKWLATLAVCLAAILPAELAASDGIYECPNLNNAAKTTLAHMTQGKDGWFFRKSDVDEYYDLLPHAREYIVRLTRAFASQGTTLYLLQVPPRPFAGYPHFDKTQPPQDSFNLEDGKAYYGSYIQALQQAGANVIEMLDLMHSYDKQNDLYFFFKRDHHWTPFGASLVAKRVGEVLKQNPKYQAIASSLKQYRSEVTGKIDMNSMILKELQTLCTSKVPAEKFPAYQTNLVADKGEDALFGSDDENPPLVLLGSSFSAVPMFNFDGFLSEHTGLDVANFAISAGGLFNSIVSYTSLPKEKRLNPQFIVWENLAHYDFNLGDSMFRQLIPSVYGECSAEEAIATKKLSLKSDKVDILTLNRKQKISGSDYFFYIEVDDVTLANFTLETEYDDGDGEWFVIDRREHYNNSGRFFVELSDEITSSLQKVSISGLTQFDAAMEVRLCKINKTKTATADKGV